MVDLTKLHFEPTLHRYTYDGRIVDAGVTTVIGKILAPFPDLPDKARLRLSQEFGDHAHLATALEERGTLDWSSIEGSPELMSVMDGFLDWKMKVNPTPVLIEQKLYSEVYDVCGTLDRVYRMVWDGVDDNYVVDFKTGNKVFAGAGPQMAAYKVLVNECFPDLHINDKRIVLQLLPNRVIPTTFTNKRDEYVFLYALACFHWRKENGYL